MLSIKHIWGTYKEKMVPKEAGVNQIRDTQMAFYAGFISCLEMLVFISTNPNISEDEASDMLDVLHKEGNAFVESVGSKDAKLQ